MTLPDTNTLQADDAALTDVIARLFGIAPHTPLLTLPAPDPKDRAMPSASTVNKLLEARRARAMDEWYGRLEQRVTDHGSGSVQCVALVRILHGDAIPGPTYENRWAPTPEEISAAARTLRVTVLRHLGEDEFLLALHRTDDQNQLALAGHLDVARGAYRMIAL